MKKVFITGANGFIGRHTIHPLIERGYEVIAISSQKELGCSSPVQTISCNLLDPYAVSQVLEEIQPSHLLHLAWYTKHGMFWDAVENVAWVKASLHLLEEFKRRGGKRAVFAGSCAEYDWSKGAFSEDEAFLHPESLYGKAKNSLRILSEEFAKKKSLSFAWGRIFFLYGPYEDPKKLIPSMILKMAKGHHFIIENGSLVRDFLHVHDVAEAFAAILDSDIQGAMNVASGEGVTLQNVGNLVEKTLKVSNLLQCSENPSPLSSQHRIIADVTKLKTILGWKPLYSLEKGLVQNVKWWQNASEFRG